LVEETDPVAAGELIGGERLVAGVAADKEPRPP
jgi:hypothetical protein